MPRTIAKDYDAKRQNILRLAAKVFAEHGVARASMTLVAQECGISKANIYHYCDSKDALLFDVLDTYLAALHARLVGLPLAGKAPQDQFRLFLSETLLAYEGMDNEHKIQTEGIAVLPAEQQAILKGYQRDIVAKLSDILGRAAAPELAQDPKRLRQATMSVFGMLNWFYMWAAQADKDAREDYARFVADLTLNGVSRT